jgi:hypothetical protein
MERGMSTQPPFAGLQRALDLGHLRLDPDVSTRSRHYDPDWTGLSSVDREGRIRYGAASLIPELRRQIPREERRSTPETRPDGV